MSYEIHEDGVCDKCGEKPSIHVCPFLYLDRNDRAHENLGDGYRQYYLCKECLDIEMRIINRHNNVM